MQAHRNTENNRTAFLSDAEVLVAASDIVDDFIELAVDLSIGQDFLDISVLPVSRKTIENAFRLEIAVSMRPARREDLIQGGTLLAQFQPDVGHRVSLSPAANIRGQLRENDAFGTLIERILAQAQTDRERLSELFREADRIACRRYEFGAHPPFHEDGTYSWYGHDAAH